MKGAMIHGILLAVMLVYGYRTWTRDKTVRKDIGQVSLWDKTEAELVSIEYKAEKKIVKLERKGAGADQYWWGSDTTIEMKPKATPKPPEAGSGSAGSGSAGSGSAGSGSAGSGSAAVPPKVEEEEVSRKTKEFPLGEPGDTLIKNFAAARALRDLGTLDDKQRADYELDKPKATLTVTFKDGARTFDIGGAVFGGQDKYALDKTSGHAYVLSRDLVSGLEIGESSLHLTDARGFEATKIDRVTIESNGRSKVAMRLETTGDDGKEVKTWADVDVKKGNQTLANFIDSLNRLTPTEYAADMKASDMTPIMKVTYKDDRGALLGTMQLYKFEKAGELPPNQTLDPANPPKGDVEYYIVTEKTRVPAQVRKDLAQRMESDIETVFSGKDEAAGSGSAGSGAGAGPKNPPPPPGLFSPHGAAPPVPKAPMAPAPAAPAPAAPRTPAPAAPAPAPAH
ncbi:MAG TPA: DUF4340 domain-containing protein [Kofleriaceae bacterium]|nr:DUF4340 domain-containing protein [Kofleriaceae bacterium]